MVSVFSLSFLVVLLIMVVALAIAGAIGFLMARRYYYTEVGQQATLYDSEIMRMRRRALALEAEARRLRTENNRSRTRRLRASPV